MTKPAEPRRYPAGCPAHWPAPPAMPEPDQAGGWQHPGWSWTYRNDRLIQAAYWLSGLLTAFALGDLPSLVTDDWKSDTTWVSLWLSVAATVIAAAAFGIAEIARRGRGRMISETGRPTSSKSWPASGTTIKQPASGRASSASSVGSFKSPGPVEADRSWDWSLDVDAREWGAKVDELVRAFRVLNIDAARDGTNRPSGVFLWAYWPVAAAFGMRATAADRALILDVWQRPSHARAGE